MPDLPANQSNNQVQKFLRNDSVQQRIEQLLKDRASQFTTSLLATVNTNQLLSQCKPETVLNAALTAAALDLPINSNLGFAYVIPYKNNKQIDDPETGKKTWVSVYEAQFQMGYRGFIQLAQRSGQYKRIAATPVYEGQLKEEDPLAGNTYVWDAKTSDKIIGYVSRLELVNGFKNDLYMTAEEMETHGARYSQSYKADKKYKSDKSLWSTDFDTMGMKTVLKLNISKWGPMSVEMQKAVESDQAVIRDTGPEYIDGEVAAENKDEATRARIAAAETKHKEMTETEHMPKAVKTKGTKTDDAV